MSIVNCRFSVFSEGVVGVAELAVGCFVVGIDVVLEGVVVVVELSVYFFAGVGDGVVQAVRFVIG